jgi:23S rRNA (guanine745-N1)-methyltransferase
VRLPGSVISLALDISKDAARARRWPMAVFAVADLWGECVDLVISFFTPKNFPEMARVLRPGG